MLHVNAHKVFWFAWVLVVLVLVLVVVVVAGLFLSLIIIIFFPTLSFQLVCIMPLETV